MMIEALRRGEFVSDDIFDTIYPGAVRSVSPFQWTPVVVAAKAARALVAEPGARVLDIGCGPGKFCFVGALTTSGAFFGIEQRQHLVEQAEAIRCDYNIQRVSFMHGNMVDLDWAAYNAFYMFNPFFENISDFSRIDCSIPTCRLSYERYVATVQLKLEAQPIGTRVAIYQGFGGDMPKSYRLRSREVTGSDFLNLWVKYR